MPRQIRCPDRDRVVPAGRYRLGPSQSNRIVNAETFDEQAPFPRTDVARQSIPWRRVPGSGSRCGGPAASRRGLLLLSLSCAIAASAALRSEADDRPVADDTNTATPAETRTSEKLLITSLLKSPLQEQDWTFVSREKDAKLSDTWGIVQEGEDTVLICTGMPYGYLRTTQKYDDFEMELEWRFPDDENGNSGILLYTSEEDKVWPDSIQVQLHQPVAGSIFPSAGARSDNEIRDVRNVARPINQWNVCRISSSGGTISVDINGKRIGEVTGCRPSRGWIALQSEGAEVHFRRIRIREMPPVAAPEAAADQSTSWMPRLMKKWNLSEESCRPGVLQFEPPAPAVDVSTHARRAWRRDRRLRKFSHVVDRESLAACCDPACGGHRLCLDVAGTSTVLVARGIHHQHRAGRRSAGF
jgi:hypothetical protein